MSFFVVLKSKNAAGKQNSGEYHIPFKTSLPLLTNEEIDFIQADSDELDTIVDKFTINNQLTIPMPRNLVVRWYGDIAKTIYYNLR